MSFYGLNVLAQYVNNRTALLSLIDALKPSHMLIMDDHGLAVQLRRQYPSMTVIYRAWHPNDAEWHHHVTPDEWLNAHAHLATDGLYIQCANEPSGYSGVPKLVTWCVEVMQKAKARGIRLAIPAFGVGHPSETLLRQGAFDAFIHALGDNILLLHEYMLDDPNGEPWHIGRGIEWIQRASTIGAKKPTIVIGEFGRDKGGGHLDGWRGVGWSETFYFNRLQAAQNVYKALFGHYLPTLIFCYGKGAGGHWQSFDVEGANTLLNSLVEENKTMATNTTPPQNFGNRIPLGRITVKTTGGAPLRVRSSMSTANLSNVVGFFSPGTTEEVPYWDAAWNGWKQLEYAGKIAYVSADLIEFTPVTISPPVTPPTNPDLPPFPDSIEEMKNWRAIFKGFETNASMAVHFIDQWIARASDKAA